MELTLDWNLTDIYKDEKEALKDFDKIKELYRNLDCFKGQLNNKEKVLEYLNYKSEILKINGKLSCYLFLRMSLNGKDQFPRKMNAEFTYFSQEMSPLLIGLSYELKKNDNKTLLEWKSDHRFKDFDLTIDDIIEEKKHDLSKNTENILSLNTTYGGFNTAFEKNANFSTSS